MTVRKLLELVVFSALIYFGEGRGRKSQSKCTICLPGYYDYRGNFYTGANYSTFTQETGQGNFGYFGGNLFDEHYVSRETGGLFGSGARPKALALGKGPGFIGGGMPSVAAMLLYHEYKLYQTKLDKNQEANNECLGDCPDDQTFCDSGLCRCKSGYDARYGQCWNKIEDFNQINWEERKTYDFNPFISCTSHSNCHNLDMNLICGQSGTCQCRNDMKWNNAALECQVFVDVNCTDIEDTKSILRYYLDEDEYFDSFYYQEAGSEENLDVSKLSFKKALDNLKLANLNNNETGKFKEAFCLDMARIIRSYEDRIDAPSAPLSLEQKIMIPIVTVLLLVLAFFQLRKYWPQIKEKLGCKNKDDGEVANPDVMDMENETLRA